VCSSDLAEEELIKVQFNDDTSVLGCDVVSLIEQFPVLSRQ
jgi:hypothetical protein